MGVGIEVSLTYCDFPSEHWKRILIDNFIERLNRENLCCNRVVVSFSDGNSVFILLCAKLCHVAWHPKVQQEVHEHELPGGFPPEDALLIG